MTAEPNGLALSKRLFLPSISFNFYYCFLFKEIEERKKGNSLFRFFSHANPSIFNYTDFMISKPWYQFCSGLLNQRKHLLLPLLRHFILSALSNETGTSITLLHVTQISYYTTFKANTFPISITLVS